MRPEILHEIENVCAALVLAGLRKNPYPMVNPQQERRWQRKSPSRNHRLRAQALRQAGSPRGREFSDVHRALIKARREALRPSFCQSSRNLKSL